MYPSMLSVDQFDQELIEVAEGAAAKSDGISTLHD
jgi:hypothetical protein